MPPRQGGSVEVDNVAEPLRVKLTNNAGQLEAEVTHGVSEWNTLDGRRYRASVSVRRKASK